MLIFPKEELLTISLELRGPSSDDCVEFINFVLEIAVCRNYQQMPVYFIGDY